MKAPKSAIDELRQRRRAEPEAVDTRSAILLATESALATTPLHNLNVAQLIREAGVSRATFYSYFESKYDVVAALLARVMDQMYEFLGPLAHREEGSTREDALRQTLTTSIALWREHAAVFRATHENWHAVPELRAMWLALVERFTDAVADVLVREAEPGSAIAVTARHRAAAVLWATERLIYVAISEADDDLVDDEQFVETLLALWVGTLFADTRRGESTYA